MTGTPHRVRTDLSATLFLSAPEDYEGGELVIADTFGTHRVKLPAGDLILYPGTSLHRVEPVTHGIRLASFFWIESMVRDDSQRQLLFDLDTAIQQLAATVPENPAVDQLLNVYHNLLRQWAMHMIRRIIGQIHLWTGLVLFVPFVLLGLTGSLLVFEDELNNVFGPNHRAAGGAARPASEIIAAARAVAPAGFVPVGYTAPMPPAGWRWCGSLRGGGIAPARTWFASG